MKNNSYLTISEFSKIAEVSRKALIFYDNIGLFCPEYTGENGYRYYSHEQIYIIFVINILKELGTPLNQIKAFMKNCTPADAISLLKQQDEILSQKIAQLQCFQDMLNTKLQRLEQAEKTEISKVLIVQQEKQPLFISDPIDQEKAEIADDIWLRFYEKSKAAGVAFGYPEGFLVSRENLLKGKTSVAEHIICHVGNPKYANNFMPKGTYLCATSQGSFYDTEPLYHEMIKYIKNNQLEILGAAYEERIVDEIGSKDKANQKIQIKILIQ